MDPTRKTDRLLEEWDAVARSVRQPATAPRRRGLFVGSTLGLLGAAALAVVVLVGVSWLGGRMTTGDVGGSPTPLPSQVAVAPSPSPSASSSPSVTPSPWPSPSATPEPTPTPTPTPVELARCVDVQADGKLDARITSWEGAAGNRIADVSVTNHSSAACEMAAQPIPELIDRNGKVLAHGDAAAVPPTGYRINAGQTVTTLVDVSNVCVDNPAFPLTVAFWQGGADRIVARPLSADDMTVPPCNGPGFPASIQMQPWSR